MPHDPQSPSIEQTDVDWQWQRLRIETLLHDCEGTAFEQFFQQIAARRWPGTFTPSIPMGKRGDLKCDGYESTAKAVFQCYGPRSLKIDETNKKIEADIRGAKLHWDAQMHVWRFVHNTPRDALPSEIIRHLAKLANELAVPYETWGRPLILDTAKDIPAQTRSELWGRAPRAQDVRQRVTFDGIGRVLAFISSSPSASDLDAIELPAGYEEKCAHNLLSVASNRFLRLGLHSESRVGEYLKRQVEPSEADRLADAFKARYRALRSEGLTPDDILTEMIIYAGGITGNMDHDAAALSVAAYFFVTCDIFERPPGGDGEA